jgi:acetyl-CoA carboxylase beta subunit
VIEYFQVTEHLFGHGLFDLIVPCNLLKGVLSELFQLYSLPRKEKKNERLVLYKEK